MNIVGSGNVIGSTQRKNGNSLMSAYQISVPAARSRAELAWVESTFNSEHVDTEHASRKETDLRTTSASQAQEDHA
ncbi:hypothetical protein AB0K73_12900 [Agromyces sp. NPDC052230]